MPHLIETGVRRKLLEVAENRTIESEDFLTATKVSFDDNDDDYVNLELDLLRMRPKES